MVINMMRARKRRYTKGARSVAATARKDRIVEVALRLFLDKPYDLVSLQAVASAAGVALKTVTRKFGSKEALLIACAHERAKVEEAARAVTPGDATAAAAVLTRRYETIAKIWLRFLALEERIEAVEEVIAIARASHLGWLATVFSSVLELRPAQREQRLAELFGATEFNVWHSWRRHLGLGREAATHAMADMLEALIERWQREGGETK